MLRRGGHVRRSSSLNSHAPKTITCYCGCDSDNGSGVLVCMPWTRANVSRLWSWAKQSRCGHRVFSVNLLLVFTGTNPVPNSSCRDWILDWPEGHLYLNIDIFVEETSPRWMCCVFDKYMLYVCLLAYTSRPANPPAASACVFLRAARRNRTLDNII